MEILISKSFCEFLWRLPMIYTTSAVLNTMRYSTAYFGVILSVLIYGGWKIIKRPSARKPLEMDLLGGLEEIDADEQWWKENYQPPTTLWGKFVEWLL